MTALRVAVVDDETIARDYLARILKDQEGVQLVDAVSDAASVLHLLEIHPIDILFADIRMPGMSGLELVERLVGLNEPPDIVFTTAFGSHALAAFELGAVDYIVKPFGETRVAKTLDRIRRQRASGTGLEGLARVHGTLAQLDQPLDRIFVRGLHGVRQITVANVIRFSAADDYVMAHTIGCEHLIAIRLNVLEKRLPVLRFLRIHRSHIVNLEHLSRFTNQANGTMAAHMIDGSEVPVSRRYAGAIRGVAK